MTLTSVSVGQSSPRAVVYLYTQTGQLREVSAAFTAPMRVRGWDIRSVDVCPRHGFPFPWPVRGFFGIFSDAVDPNGLVDLVEPEAGFAAAEDELVILAYQVWYLAPSLPIRSLLRRYPEAVAGRDVVSVIACRNMWYSAAAEVSGLLRSAGARRVNVVAATDTRNSATTLVTTLRWLLTGKRGPFLWFDSAGVDDEELARVAALGQLIADSSPLPLDAAPVVPALAAADLIAGRAFRRWGTVVRSAGARSHAAHAVSVGAFVAGLALAIAVGLPALGLASLVGGQRFSSAVRGAVYRAIAFNDSTSNKVVVG